MLIAKAVSEGTTNNAYLQENNKKVPILLLFYSLFCNFNLRCAYNTVNMLIIQTTTGNTIQPINPIVGISSVMVRQRRFLTSHGINASIHDQSTNAPLITRGAITFNTRCHLLMLGSNNIAITLQIHSICTKEHRLTMYFFSNLYPSNQFNPTAIIAISPKTTIIPIDIQAMTLFAWEYDTYCFVVFCLRIFVFFHLKYTLRTTPLLLLDATN